MRDRVAAANRLIDNFRYRIRRKFLHVKWAYYLVIKLQHALHIREHTVAHDDDKSSLCSLRQLRFAIMENCRHTSLALCIICFIIACSWTQPDEIVYSLRIWLRTDAFSSVPLLTYFRLLCWKVKNKYRELFELFINISVRATPEKVRHNRPILSFYFFF